MFLVVSCLLCPRYPLRCSTSSALHALFRAHRKHCPSYLQHHHRLLFSASEPRLRRCHHPESASSTASGTDRLKDPARKTRFAETPPRGPPPKKPSASSCRPRPVDVVLLHVAVVAVLTTPTLFQLTFFALFTAFPLPLPTPGSASPPASSSSHRWLPRRGSIPPPRDCCSMQGHDTPSILRNLSSILRFLISPLVVLT